MSETQEEPQMESQDQTDTQVEPQAQAEPQQVESQAEAEPQPQAESQAEAEPQQLESQAEVAPQPESQAQTETVAEAKPQAQETNESTTVSEPQEKKESAAVAKDYRLKQEPKLNVDLANAPKWIDEDLQLIQDDTKWKLDKDNKKTNVKSYIYKRSGDSVWWLKVTAVVNEGTYENCYNLLHSALTGRQKEWHHLFVDGGRLWQWPSSTANSSGDSSSYSQEPAAAAVQPGKLDDLGLYYYQYRSPIALVSPRDVLYLKALRNIDNDQFILTYRTVNAKDIDPTRKPYVRTNFQSSHYIKRLSESSFEYTVIQHAHPGGWVLPLFSNKPQLKVLIEEVAGVRKAVQNPIITPDQ